MQAMDFMTDFTRHSYNQAICAMNEFYEDNIPFDYLYIKAKVFIDKDTDGNVFRDELRKMYEAESNGFYLDKTLGEVGPSGKPSGVWLVMIDGLIIGEAETLTQALETFKEAMRVQREHLRRNPENKE